MTSEQRDMALLKILRGSTFQDRDTFFRAALKIDVYQVTGEMKVYADLMRLENREYVSIDRVRVGSHSKLVSIRLTEKGLWGLVEGELVGVVKQARIDMPSRMPKKKMPPAEKPMPCGQVVKKCYHAGCYLAWKCKAHKDSQ